ncbi:hypothetical protein DL93DRAFT_2099282 [Clavulina sp. PMI_390]|nr:hypothetical protein DL93DRAFT_2099282 [Clavulina sp. PMI_390]
MTDRALLSDGHKSRASAQSKSLFTFSFAAAGASSDSASLIAAFRSPEYRGDGTENKLHLRCLSSADPPTFSALLHAIEKRREEPPSTSPCVAEARFRPASKLLRILRINWTVFSDLGENRWGYGGFPSEDNDEALNLTEEIGKSSSGDVCLRLT